MDDFRLEGDDRRRRDDWGCRDRIDCSARWGGFDGFEDFDELGTDRDIEPIIEVAVDG